MGAATAAQMRSTVENGSTFGAEQVSPACRLATLIGSRLDGRVVAPFALLGDREEVDGKADPSDRLHFVLDLGRYRLGGAGTHDDIQFGLGLCDESQVTIVHNDPAPRSRRGSVRSSETGGHRVLVPSRARSNQLGSFWHFGSITEWTVERLPETTVPASSVQYPSTELEGRAMTNVLAVAA